MTLRRLFLFVLALLGPAAPVFATEAVSEQSVRAALVFNFIKFTEWPAATQVESPFRLCIATNDREQFAALEALKERRVRGKPLVTARFDRHIECDVIYVDSRQYWNEIRETRTTALTVGSYAGFAANGGMIEIFLQDGRPRFDINLGEAKRVGLRFYPQLLQLARRILE